MAATEHLLDEEKQKRRMFKATKFFFLVTIIYSLWIAVLILGAFFLQMGNKWAILTLEQWLLSAIALISIAIGLEVVLFIQYTISIKKQREPKKQKQKEYLQGKQVHNYTIPFEAKGGIFSKTYILIDENQVLNLRYQMIPPNDLWRQQQ